MSKKSEVVTDVRAETEYTEAGRQDLLHVETSTVGELLQGVALEVNNRPQIWAQFAAAALCATPGHDPKAGAQSASMRADALLDEWEKRFSEQAV